MANPFQFYPQQTLKPCWAVDSLIYQQGPAEFPDGSFFQTVDISTDVVTKEYATDLLANFQALGYKNAAGLTTKYGGVVKFTIIRNPADPTDDRDMYMFEGPDSTGNYYEGTLADYQARQCSYNAVNGGGVGNPGSWKLPKGQPEPVWVPVPAPADAKPLAA
jgi:hypothetical protein